MNLPKTAKEIAEENRLRAEMDRAWDIELQKIKALIKGNRSSSSESSESEEEEHAHRRRRHKKSKAMMELEKETSTPSEERESPLKKEGMKKAIAYYKQGLKQIVTARAKTIKKGDLNALTVLTSIDARINAGQALSKAMWDFLGTDQVRFEKALKLSADRRELDILAKAEGGNADDAPVAPTSNLLYKGTIPTIGTDNFWASRTRPEQKGVLGNIKSQVAAQGSGMQEFTNITTGAKVCVSNQEVLDRIIARSQAHRPIDPVAATSIQARLNRGQNLSEEILREIFS